MTSPARRPRSLLLAAALALLVTAHPGLLGVAAPTASAVVQVAAGDPVGDFEAPGTAPQGWTASAALPNQVVAIGSRAVSGARSLLVRDASTTAAATATRKKLTVTPSREYIAQAYAFTTQGTQTMTLDFYDADGARIQRYHAKTPGAHGTWSRVVVRGPAPAAARSATVQLSSSSTDVSEAWWDAVQVIGPALPNPSFEETGTPTAPAPGWSAVAGLGTTITTTTAHARTGTRSLLVADSSGTGSAVVRSAAVPVFPAVGHEVRLWVRPVSGTFVLGVKWYSASGAYLSGQTRSLSYPAGDWRLVKQTVTAPRDAAKAVLEISSRAASTATAAFDTVSLLPHPGAPVRATSTRSLGDPLTFDNTMVVDGLVIGGRPKLATVVSGYPAAFQVLDIQTDTVEVNIPFPVPEISQTPAMTTGDDGRVYIGTPGGRLWRWERGSTSLEDLGRVTPGASAIWDLETAPDGRIWGGTSPDGAVFAFDPASDTVVARERVSASHTYIRSVAVDDTHVYVGASPTDPTFFRLRVGDLTAKSEIAPPVRLRSGQLSELEVNGRFLAFFVPSGTTTRGESFGGSRYLYDLRTGYVDHAASVPGQRPSEADSAGGFYYFTYKQLHRVDGETGERTVQTSTTMAA